VSSQSGQKKVVGELLRAIAAIVEDKRPSQRGHSPKVAHYAGLLAAKMGLAEEEQEAIETAALLHDIGYLAVPLALRNKGGPSLWESHVIRSHPTVGAELLSRLPWLKGVVPYVRHHHERVDGLGYPEGLIGDQIPVGAQILALAEFFVKGLEVDSGKDPNYRWAMKRMTAESGKRFAPSILKVFLEAVGKWALVDLDQFRIEVGHWLSEAVTRLLETGAGLPVRKQAAEQLQALAEGEQSLQKAVQVVETDPGLALKVIAKANSAAYSEMEPVKDVHQASVRLGLKEVGTVLEGLKSGDIFTYQEEGRLGRAFERWWRESLFCALTARALAQETGAADPALVYHVGLLRLIGRAVMLSAYHQENPVEDLTDRQFAVVMDLVEAQAWPLSRGLMATASLEPSTLQLAAPLGHPKRVPPNESERLILAVADSLAQITKEVDVPEGLVVRCKDFQQVMNSARLNLPPESQLMTLKKVRDLYHLLYKGKD